MREIIQEKLVDAAVVALRPFEKPIRKHFIKKNRNEIIEVKKKKVDLEKVILKEYAETQNKRYVFKANVKNLLDFCEVYKSDISKQDDKKLSDMAWEVYLNNPHNTQYRLEKYMDEYELIIAKLYASICDKRLYLGAEYKGRKEDFNYRVFRNRVVSAEIDNIFNELFEREYSHKKIMTGFRSDR